MTGKVTAGELSRESERSSGNELGPVFRLGNWEVAADTCTLSNGDEVVKITPRSMEVLVYLATHYGQVVSSKELLDKLWTNITSDHAVHKAIAELRGAVDDSGTRQSFIVTVPKRGYKLNVEPVALNNTEQSNEFNGSELLDILRQKVFQHRKAALAAMTVLITVSLFMTRVLTGTEADAIRVGVLPFRVDVSSPQEDHFLADGLTNSLLNGLSKLNQLAIMSLPHDSRYSTTNRAAREIGSELGIDYLLEGRLMQASHQARVNVRLVRLEDGVQLYSEQFDMEEQNIFMIQDTIASSMVDSLRIHLDESERSNMLDWGTTDATAYRHFMMGEFYNNQFNPGDFNLAIEHHSKAIEIDPNFDNAYLGLATAANNLAVYSRMDRIEELRDLVSEVHRRIASLNRESKVLNSIQAITTRMSGVNHLEQEETLRQQILSGSPPDYALAHYALFLIGARLFDEAQQYLNLASEVDPFEISPDEIWSYRADIATPAEEVLIRKLQLQERPNHIGILGTVGRNLALEGRLDEARSYIDHQRELDTEGVSAHLTAVVVGVLDGTINADSKDSAVLEQHYALGSDYNFSNGVLAFMLGDFQKGKEFWTQLQPIQKRRLRNLVYAVEKFFPHEILECDCYQLMLEDLGVGKSWQHTLMRGVIEMETATGVSLSDSARRALAEDRLMSRNNLWPDSVWSSIESKLP